MKAIHHNHKNDFKNRIIYMLALLVDIMLDTQYISNQIMFS